MEIIYAAAWTSMQPEQTEVNMQLTALQFTNVYNASGIRQMFDYIRRLKPAMASDLWIEKLWLNFTKPILKIQRLFISAKTVCRCISVEKCTSIDSMKLFISSVCWFGQRSYCRTPSNITYYFPILSLTPTQILWETTSVFIQQPPQRKLV